MKTSLFLFAVFILAPILEISLIIEVGSRIGGLKTTLTLVMAGVIGVWLGKRAGRTVLREMATALQRGETPTVKIVEGAMALVGAVLLVIPGYLSDVVGLLLLWGPTRRWMAARVQAGMGKAVQTHGFHVPGGARPEGKTEPAEAAFDHPVIE